MPTRFRILGSLIITFILYALLNYWFQRSIVFPSFLTLENEQVQNDLKRCVESINRDIRDVNMFCMDWACWDDTYQYIQDKNQSYVESNLSETAFHDNKLNILFYIDKERKVVWGKATQENWNKEIPLSQFPPDTWPENHLLLGHAGIDSATSGIMLTEIGPMFISSRPITTSLHKGPIQGTLVAGRLLDAHIINGITAQEKVDFQLKTITDKDFSKEDQSLLSELATGRPIVFRISADNQLYAYSSFKDFNGHPVLLLRVSIPRKIAAQGNATIHNALLSILSVGLIALLVMYLILKRMVIDPLLAKKKAEEQLKVLSSAIEQAGDFIIITDCHGIIEYVNPKFIEFSEYQIPEAIGRTPRILKSGHHSEEFYAHLWKTLLQGEIYRGTIINKKKDGVLYIEEKTINPLKNEEGEIIHFVSTGRDVTDRKRAEEAIAQSERMYRGAIEVAEAVPYYYNYETNRYDFVGAGIEALTGYTQEDFTPDAWSKIIVEEIPIGVLGGLSPLEAHKKAREDGINWRSDCQIINKNGVERWLTDSAVMVKNRLGIITGSLGILLDITHRKEAEKRIEHLAYFDSLTGLPNRKLFLDRLNVAMAHTRRAQSILAILFLDLDRFKDINDSLGHSVGDDLLQQTSLRLRECLREGDTLARMGGDEFLILLPHINKPEDVAVLSQRILDRLNKSFMLGSHNIYISASIGIVLFPSDADDSPSMLRAADIAMYNAKRSGGNKYRFFTADINEQILSQIMLANHLRRAVEGDEFVIHYQPQINIQTGRIIGMEALIRWQHPESGLIAPGRFIPLAEEIGLISAITDIVLRKTCTQYPAWKDSTPFSLRLAVNISPLHLRKKDFVTSIKNIIEETGMNPDNLELELTESILIDDAESVMVKMEELNRDGIHFSIDDFGTGYSSLAYLKKMRVDKLKIDQSFVRDIVNSPDDQAISKTIISIGHSMGLTVIAEGVETEEQLSFLRELGCDEVQGFFISRPVPELEFVRFLEQCKK